MKITIICHEIPYPINNGGRADAWRRIKAFSEFGAEIQLITWYKDDPSSDELTEMDRYVHRRVLIPFPNSFLSQCSRLFDLGKFPLEVTSRIVRGQALFDLQMEVEEFAPQIIWLDHLHAAEIGHFLAERYSIPMVTRSHNIEHLYYKRLRASADSLSAKFKRTLSTKNLYQYEVDNLRRSALFYDISLDDLKFWQEQGFANGRYLPPLIDFKAFDRDIETAGNSRSLYDLVFLGNLYSDNNVAGVSWFVEEVLPKIQQALPDVSLLIAGSNPITKIQELCEANPNIELRINPPCTSIIYNSARVLVNPTSTGSGVNMKSLEMLLAQKPIVSQPQGIAGLSEELVDYFTIARNAEDFATAVVDLLQGTRQAQIADRPLLESLFGFRAIDRVLREMKTITKNTIPQEPQPTISI